MTMIVRLVRPFGPFEIDTGGARFSTEIPAGESDALLCEWDPTGELSTFQGPSAWYTAEPRTNSRIGVLAHPDQRRFLDILRPDQILHHAHADPRYRVPHMTHETTDPPAYSGPRHAGAVSVVSNYGGPIHNRGPEVRMRNAFVTTPGVELFGRRAKWRHYRPRGPSWPRAPSTFRGAVEEAAPDKIELLARYHTAICLENSCEPEYFSEKFVDGARAGCVPIYHAHPTVRDGVLAGAAWVDPADHDMDPVRTLHAAAAADRETVASQNRAWLDGAAVRATSRASVWARIAEALRFQKGGDA